mgnify:CR=1 FL=1
MKIKKYIATSMKDGKDKVLRELGEDAVILSTRTSPNPQGGQIVEIVAAIDDNVASKTSNKTNQIIEKKKFIETTKAQQLSAKATVAPTTDASTQALSREVNDIKKMLFEVADLVKYKYTGNHTPVLTKIHKTLIDNEVSEEIALKITSKINALDISNNAKEAVFEARNTLIEDIETTQAIEKSSKRQVILFVGSTGGGKTTSLVKIAVICKLVLNANILIVSADAYKVGGIEQLQTYSSIAAIPFVAAYSTDELREIVDRELDRDFIFIDTTGKNHKSPEFQSYLKDCVDAALPEKVFLIQPATTNKKTFKKVINDLNFVKPSSIILTKVDEAETLGGILSSLKEFKVPISYITTGQKVPDDIEPVDLLKLARLVLPDSLMK